VRGKQERKNQCVPPWGPGGNQGERGKPKPVTSGGDVGDEDRENLLTEKRTTVGEGFTGSAGTKRRKPCSASEKPTWGQETFTHRGDTLETKIETGKM